MTSILECLVLIGFAVVSMTLAALGFIASAGMVYFGIGPCMGWLGARRGAAQRRLSNTRAAAA
jgi:hypothetical protein